LLLLFIGSRLFSQVAAPDLRCLEVINANGDVKLSWIPPADPNHAFSSYDIWYSNLASGPFSNVGAVGAITATTFVHTNTVSTVQSVYYFIVSRYGSSGVSSSIPSDTLHSIFLNIHKYSIAECLTLDYNPIHQPNRPGTDNNYKIIKEYPLGTWSNFFLTTNTLCYDTINVCKAKMNYQVIVKDNSGVCFSASNINGGEYTNTKSPNRPYVDSVSVLPNGNVILGWEVPYDKDINQYEIQYRTPTGSNVALDVVNGRNTTSYLYQTTSANSNSVGLFVQSVDSCGAQSTVNYDVRTIYLSTKYNSCAYQTELNWNEYVWSPGNETLEYRIYYTVAGGQFKLLATTTTTTYTHNKTKPGELVGYFVRVINRAKTITSSSNRNFFFSSQVEAASFVYMQSASVIDKNSVQLKLYIDTVAASVGINIYRSEDSAHFTMIGFIPYIGRHFYSYLDNTAETTKKSYWYKTMVRDSCSNERTPGNVSKTMLLRVQEDKEKIFTKHLNWSKYEGFAAGVSGYNIYRIINDVSNSTPFASTDAQTTSYQDELENESTNGARIDYYVEAIESFGNPYGIKGSSNSNLGSVYMEGRLFVPTAFAPEGINKLWLPITYFVDKSDYHVSIFNRWGKKIFETSDDKQAWDGADCPADVYVYLISYKNARGEYLDTKGTVM
ncbi:MAG: gliding motility-associated C-terminal domain-containing protein, partial [Bacteroidota bacterium]